MSEELVFVLGSTGAPKYETCVRGFDLASGRVAWETPLPGPKGEPHTMMAVADEVIVVATGGAHIFCMQRETGLALWERTAERIEKSNTSQPLILITRDRVIVGLQGVTSAFDMSGSLAWQSRDGVSAIGVPGRTAGIN